MTSTDTTTQAIDEVALGQLMEQVVGYMTGGAMCFGIWLGDELGLYRTMAGSGPLTSDEVAANAGCNPRLVRELLDGQVAGGLVSWDAETDRYELSPEAAMVLADDTSPAFVARAMNAFGSLFMDIAKVTDAFKSDGALSWAITTRAWSRAPSGSFEPGTGPSCRIGSRRSMESAASWPPAARWPTSAAATAPRRSCSRRLSRTRASSASISTSRRSRPRGSEPRKQGLATASPSQSPRRGDTREPTISSASSTACTTWATLSASFATPVSILRKAGRVLLVEPFALDDRATNLTDNPMAALLYTASSSICTPNSLSQEVGLGLGAQAGEARLREVVEQAGFTRFRRAAETPLNLILEARV